MQCFDCAKERGVATEAVAICTVCGAALCPDHSIEGFAQIEFSANPGDPVAGKAPGRRVFCRSCAPGYTKSAA